MRYQTRRNGQGKNKHVNGIQFPITVRQAQKLVASLQKLGSSPFPGEIRQALSLNACDEHAEALNKLAKLASQNPNQVLIDASGKSALEPENSNDTQPEYAPKGTDEFQEQSETPSDDSTVHGGDNASQEVEDGQSGGGNDSLENEAQLQAPTADGGSQGQGCGDSQESQGTETSERNAPQSDGSETGGNSTSDGCESGGKSQAPTDQKAGTSEPPNSDSGESTETSPESDIDQQNDAAAVESGLRDDQVNQGSESEQETETEGRTQEKASDAPTHQKKWGKSFSRSEREGKLSLTNSTNNGGATASLKVAGVSPKLLKICRQRLAALVGDNSEKNSPRRDYTEFCVRLKTYRNPQPARVEEEGRPTILVLADVSGSCRNFSKESVKVAKAASRLGIQGADVVVVSHYNGTPHEMEINGEVVDVRSIKPKAVKNLADNGCNWGNSSGWYEALMQRYNITVVIALGDWDGSLEYAYIAQHPQIEKLIWLDNAHCTTRGTVKDNTKFAIENYSQNFTGVKIPVLRQKLIYRDGCKDAVDFINNIKI